MDWAKRKNKHQKNFSRKSNEMPHLNVLNRGKLAKNCIIRKIVKQTKVNTKQYIDSEIEENLKLYG